MKTEARIIQVAISLTCAVVPAALVLSGWVDRDQVDARIRRRAIAGGYSIRTYAHEEVCSHEQIPHEYVSITVGIGCDKVVGFAGISEVAAIRAGSKSGR